MCPVIGPFQAWRFAIEGAGPDAIQAPKLEPRIMRYDFNGHEWFVIKPMFPNKSRGVRRVPAFIKLVSIRIWLRAYEFAP